MSVSGFIRRMSASRSPGDRTLPGPWSLLAIVAMCGALRAQNWRPLGPPSGRVEHALAYDFGRARTVLFGGFPTSNDTWEFDGASWRHVTTATSPAARSEHAMAFDISRGRTVLHGGTDNTTIFADTWSYDGNTWTQVITAQSPGPRTAHALAFDVARRRTVMFGFGGDTWEFDGTTWHHPITVSSPTARLRNGLSYDLVRGRTILHGGFSGTSAVTDTWEYDGLNWTQVATATTPPARLSSALAFDIARNRTILFGGGTDTWEYDGVDWRLMRPATTPPAVRGHALTFDAARQRTVLFGGGIDQCLGDTWTYDGTDWSLAVAGPSARREAALVHDTARGRTVQFGGEPTWPPWLGCAGFCYRPARDTWEFDGRSWRRTSAIAPVARGRAASTYDTRRQRGVLFGGLAAGGPVGAGYNERDTWEYDGSNWRQVTTSVVPPALWGHAMTFDQARGRVVLFGGWFSGGTGNNTWEYDGANWTAVATAAAPPERGYHALAYSTVQMATVLFGGGDRLNNMLADTWQYDGTTWTQVATAGAPPARINHAMTFDPVRGVTVVTGGWDNVTPLTDTWELSGSTWTRSPATLGLVGREATFDAERGRSLVVGTGVFELVEPAVPTWTRLGRGCSGSAGTPSLAAPANAAPALGTVFPLQLTRLPGSPGAAFLGFGFGLARRNGAALPLDLGVFGLSGCELWVEPWTGLLVMHPGTALTYPLAVPANPVLAGLAFTVQALVFDAAATNGIGALTNAGVLRPY